MKTFSTLATLTLAATFAAAQFADEVSGNWPNSTAGDFMISNFTFDSGETLDELKIHYETFGELICHDDGSTNAVLIQHGSGGEIGQFLVDSYAATLFNPGQLLDAEKYFLVIPDAIGHGESSTPRNTGLRAKFPSYQYSDMVRANHQLLTEHLGINHTRLITGVSMGGMHTWLFGEKYPDFSDALFPISSLPAQIAGHNRMWRKMFMELIQIDPAYEDGEYEKQPLTGLVGAMSVLLVMFQSPLAMQREYPTRDATDAYVDGTLQALLEAQDEFDANNLLYAYNASYTYAPEAELKKIKVPLTAVNTADDLLNPPELGILEHAVMNEMQEGVGKAVVVPASNETIGHGSYIKAGLWMDELENLLARSGPRAEGQ